MSILNSLRSVVEPLLASIEDLSSHEAAGLDSLLQRTGNAIVFRGHPSAAMHLDRRLRQAGLTTSVNLLSEG